MKQSLEGAAAGAGAARQLVERRALGGVRLQESGDAQRPPVARHGQLEGHAGKQAQLVEKDVHAKQHRAL